MDLNHLKNMLGAFIKECKKIETEVYKTPDAMVYVQGYLDGRSDAFKLILNLISDYEKNK